MYTFNQLVTNRNISFKVPAGLKNLLYLKRLNVTTETFKCKLV